MIIQNLKKQELIHPPEWLNTCHYLVRMGSAAYGMSSDDSDIDVYGFCIPPIELIFPHIKGEISGFGNQIKRFEQFEASGIRYNKNIYDINIYNIVKFFQLCMQNNPNMIDCLFAPENCIMYSDSIGDLVRQNRHIFLHKGCYHRFKGYAYSQLKKIENKTPQGKRKLVVDQFGFDTKYASHLVRLLDECEQILLSKNVNLQRNKEQLKAIRKGDVPLEEIKRWFFDKEKQLERMYAESTLPYGPDEEKIKALLVKCIERYHGRLDKFGFNGRK